jgi:phage-related minor tail protein
MTDKDRLSKAIKIVSIIDGVQMIEADDCITLGYRNFWFNNKQELVKVEEV